MARIHIEPAVNGFIVRYDDPELARANRESEDKWIDSEVTRLFDTKEAVQSAMPEILDMALQVELDEAETRAKDFSGAFALTANED